MLQIRRLEKAVDHRVAVEIEALDVDAGAIFAIVGPVDNNASLLIRLLCGVLPVGSGSIILDGLHIDQSPAARARIGVLFSDDLLYDRLSAQENLALYCQMHHLPASRVAAVLAQVGLSDQAHVRASKLAPSEQRRVAFARALLAQPDLLLLDQPIMRVDVATQTLFARLIAEVAAQGTAVVLTDEDLVWSAKFCTRVVEFEAGRITNTFIPKPPEQITEQPALTEQATAPERYVPYKVPARKDDRIVFYDPGEILYATSRDGKTILRAGTEEAATNLTLQELEQRLVGRGFFKAHRAYLVNLQHIKSVIQYTRNSYTLQLNDEQETMIPLSKQSERELQELLGY